MLKHFLSIGFDCKTHVFSTCKFLYVILHQVPKTLPFLGIWGNKSNNFYKSLACIRAYCKYRHFPQSLTKLCHEPCLVLQKNLLKKPKSTGNIQLCPSTLVDEGRYPFHLPLSVVESKLKYGLHPLRIL